MSKGTSSGTIRIKIVAVDPPDDGGLGVLFGLQIGPEVEDPVLATETSSFETSFEVLGFEATSAASAASADLDFRGAAVHGRKGDRFLYLSWGIADGDEPFKMFARAKLKLAHVPPEVIALALESDKVLMFEMAATNAKGQVASGTINPPDVQWRVSK